MPERADRLPRQDAPRGVGDGARDDHRQALAAGLHQLVEREDRGLGVERVEHGLDQEQVDAAFEQTLGLLAVRVAQFVEVGVARAGVVDVGADAGRPRRRAQRAGDEARVGRRRRGVGGLAGQARGGQVHLARQRRERVVGLRDRGRAEGVGLDDVGAGGQVGGVDVAHDLGPGQHQQVVVALEVEPVPGKARTTEVGLGQPQALDHRAHRTVDDHDALTQQRGQRLGAGVGGGAGVHANILGSRLDRSR